MTKCSGQFAAVTVLGLVATKLAQIAFLTTATLSPDPAAGRTVAVIFAPAFQTAPAYVTSLQSWAAFGLAMIAVAGGLGWVTSLLLERRGSRRARPGVGAGSCDPEPTSWKPTPAG